MSYTHGVSRSGYDFELARRNVLRHWRGIGVTVITLAVGVAAAMTLVTVLGVLEGNDAPNKGRDLYRVQMDTRLTLSAKSGTQVIENLSYPDGLRIAREGPASSTVLMAEGGVDSRNEAGEEFTVRARYTTHEFFGLFQPPMAYGSPWGEREDHEAQPVAVISDALNHRLFAGRNSVGQHVTLNGTPFQIIGVLQKWQPTPRYYDLSQGAFVEVEGAFLPLSSSRSLKMSPSSISCNFAGDGPQTMDIENAECSWLHMWVRLSSPDEVARYRQYLSSYAHDQGRIRSPGLDAFALTSEQRWLRERKGIPEGLDVFAVIAFGFLILCIINAATYLMSNFSARSREISIRRALGGSRGSLYSQLLLEALIVGTAGGVLGMLLLQACISGLAHSPTSFGRALHVDAGLLLISLLLALASSILAGLLPAWRIGQVTPARYLTSQ